MSIWLKSIHSFKIFFFVGLAYMVSSCSSVSIDDYAKSTLLLNPQEFFQGSLTAHGVLKNRSGKVTRHFTASIDAFWHHGVGTLKEKFIFDDGEVQYRNWTLTPTATGFDATAGDVLGVGKAEVAGNTMHLNYVLNIQYKGSPLALRVDDWMWLVNKETLLNESTLTKWGFKVGSIQLVIIKN
jgi:Protein of unknown function (DUF3833)